MKSKKIKIEVLIPLLAVILGAGIGGMLVRPSGEPDMVLRNRFGDVIWNHALHARMPDFKCATCHHKESLEKDAGEGAAIPKPCHDCHRLPTSADALILTGLVPGSTAEVKKKPDEGPPAMIAYHGKCRGCHVALKQGPVGCRDCHAQKFSGNHGQVAWNHLEHSRRMNELQCSTCHHSTETYHPEKEADYKGCGECHPRATAKPRPLEPLLAEHQDAVHGKCSYCHTTTNPEENITSCAACHPDLAAPTAEKTPPTAEQAVHRKCLSCHNKADPDRKEGMPAICTDCHRPSPSVLTGWPSGLLLWSHTRHLPEFNAGQWRCENCHHTDLEGFPHLACAVCHGRGHYSLPEKEMPSLARAYEKNCIECHKAKKDGPLHFAGFISPSVPGVLESVIGGIKIRWDHRLHADTLAFSCRECHHNTRTKDGALVLCPPAMNCPPQEIGALQSCRKCHGDTALVPGNPAAAAQLSAPPLDEAFRRSCLGCHQKLGAGPATWEELGKK